MHGRDCGWAVGGAHPLWRSFWVMEEMESRVREVTLSPSMMARDTHSTQPAAPVSQSLMGPGAQPCARAYGPSSP